MIGQSPPLKDNPAAGKIGFDNLIRQIEDLPSLPAVVMDVLNSIDDENIDIDVLARKVTLDQALTAKTLRLANSSFYSSVARVTTLQQAITVLGIKAVRNLVTVAAMTGCFPRGQNRFFDFKGFWRHAIATAICADVLASLRHVDQEHAFTAGLLHDIGRLALVTRFPEQYQEVLAYRAAHDCHLLTAEQDIMGIDHAAAGRMLGQHWRFSDTLQQTIGSHHDPDAHPGDTLTAIVHVADAITHGLDLSDSADDLAPPLSRHAWDKLAMDEATCAAVFSLTIARFEGINRLLT
ncbi:MAG: HDOD domain-containing protein [Proteobacteria bacterium]|nr:HDOD domain-containing protein [Pseudomonadota bacterium]